MDKKLEARIARLEKLLSNKSIKNEASDEVANAIYRAVDNIRQIVNNLCKTLAYSNISNYRDINMALQICENSFSKEAFDRLESIFEDRKSGKEF